MELIDVQLLVTHVIAFLVVLWLLRRFAWRPVLAFLRQRRETIHGEFESARSQREEADILKQDYETRVRDIDVERRQKVQEGIVEGSAAATRIKERAQEERRVRLERAAEEVRMQEESAKETLRKRTVDLAVAVAEKAIQTRLDEPKHRELIERFIDELESTRGMKDR